MSRFERRFGGNTVPKTLAAIIFLLTILTFYNYITQNGQDNRLDTSQSRQDASQAELLRLTEVQTEQNRALIAMLLVQKQYDQQYQQLVTSFLVKLTGINPEDRAAVAAATQQFASDSAALLAAENSDPTLANPNSSSSTSPTPSATPTTEVSPASTPVASASPSSSPLLNIVVNPSLQIKLPVS